MKTIVVAIALIAFSVGLFAQAPVTPVPATPKRPLGVPVDAQFFNGKWYKIIPEKIPWNSAREKARQMGGQLAVAPDAVTWTFIKRLVGGGAIWLGASDEESEGQWKWVDGTPVTFTDWGPGQPDNSGGDEDFMMTYKGHMNDLQRSGTYVGGQRVAGFLCEWSASK